MAKWKKETVTIKDVAQLAGCSAAAVCYAFSGSDKIREETRERILAAADRLGYIPNKAAQSLSRSPRHIGVVTPESYDELNTLFKRGISDAVDSYMWSHLTYTIFGYEWYSGEGQARALEELLRMPTCDGILLLLNFADCDALKPLYERVGAWGKPVVCIAESHPLLHPVATVGVDTAAVGRAAAELLMQYGCRRTSVIVGDFGSEIHRENFQGFSERAAELGLSVGRTGITYNDAETAYIVTKDILECEAPDGLFVTSYIAASVARAVRDCGRVGHCRIVGVDLCNGVADAMEHGEVMASFYQNQIEQGRTAANILADAMFAGEQIPTDRRIRLKPELVIRSLLPFYTECN